MNLPEDLKHYRAERPLKDYWLGYLFLAATLAAFVLDLLARQG